MSDKSTHRDFVWEGDYGEREPLVDALAELLSEQNDHELGMCSLFANNNPYDLEFFVVLGYEDPSEEQIERMKCLLKQAGARVRADVTFKRLLEFALRGRFNNVQVPDGSSLRRSVASKELFLLPERNYFSEKYGIEPIGKARPVFLSHATPDKQLVEDVIPYLSRGGTSLWYDKVNIEYGQSIVQAVQEGIKQSGAVVFFLSKSFLKSSWCENEMDGFLTRACSGAQVLVLSIVFSNVDHNDLPIFIQQRRYFRMSESSTAAEMSKELNPVIRDWFSL